MVNERVKSLKEHWYVKSALYFVGLLILAGFTIEGIEYILDKKAAALAAS